MYSSISYSWKLFAKLFLEKAGSFFAYFLFKESRAGSSFAYFSWGKSRREVSVGRSMGSQFKSAHQTFKNILTFEYIRCYNNIK